VNDDQDIVRALVEECLPEIIEFRQMELEMAQKAGNGEQKEMEDLPEDVNLTGMSNANWDMADHVGESKYNTRQADEIMGGIAMGSIDDAFGSAGPGGAGPAVGGASINIPAPIIEAKEESTSPKSGEGGSADDIMGMIDNDYRDSSMLAMTKKAAAFGPGAKAATSKPRALQQRRGSAAFIEYDLNSLAYGLGINTGKATPRAGAAPK